MKQQLFYTAADKRKELQILDILKADGNVDAVMLPFIDRINALPGVYTGACCEGHREGEGKDNCYVNAGYLVICLSKGAYVKLFQEGCGRSSAKSSFASRYTFYNGVSCVVDFCGGCCLFLCFETCCGNDTNEVMEEICADLEERLLPAKRYTSRFR